MYRGLAQTLHLLACLLWLIPAARIAAQEFTITTIAGGAPPPTPALATTAPMGAPTGVAADAVGNVYFSTTANCVFRLDRATGILHLFAGNSRWGSVGDGGAATAAQFRYPMGVALDGAGNVYIAEFYAHRIRRVSPSGTITTFAGNGEQGFSGDGGPATSARLSNPAGVAADNAGNVYIADYGNDRVRRVSPDGAITTVPGATGQPGTATPSYIAADGAGNLYVADVEEGLFRIVAPSGAITTIPKPPQLESLRAIAVDRTGNLYVSGSTPVPSFGGMVLRRVGPAAFTPVAGTGSSGFSGDGGPAISAEMGSPAGLAFDGAGNLYIATNSRIRRVAIPGGMVFSGTISTVAGDGTGDYSGDGGPATAAQIRPIGLAIDGTGSLYIAEGFNYRVRRVSSSGVINTVAGSGVGGYSGDGGPATSARMDLVYDVEFDSSGSLYIAEGNNHCIRRVSGGNISTVAAGFSFPTAVAVDAAGNLYVSDGDARVKRVSPSGTITTFAGNGHEGYSGDGGAATSAQLSEQPGGLAADAAGNLYIADAGNHRIRRVSPGGIITTVAGNGIAGFSGDGGSATSAQFNWPSDVVVDRAGILYIADRGNHRIRRVSPPPTPFHLAVISTIAGDGADQYSGDGGPAITAQLSSPGRIAIDAAGRLYVSTRNAVRMLTTVACTTSAAPAVLNAPAAGGPLTLTIQAPAGCAWTVLNLPAWITASATSGSGPRDITLTVAANTGAARSESITAAGSAVTVSQAAAGPVCTYSITPANWRFTRSASQGTITVTTAAGCQWAAASAAAWVAITSGANGTGPGTVNYEVQQNTAAASRSGTITVAGIVFTVEQQGTVPEMVAAGTMPQIASGGTWKTTFTLVNSGATPAMARLTFTDDHGVKLTLPLRYPQYGAETIQAGLIEPVLDPGAILIIESEAPADGPQLQGWAHLSTDGAVAGFAVFRQCMGEREQEAVVPLETRAAQGYLLAFDNTGGFVTGVAVANLSSQAGTVTVIIKDDFGRQIQTSPLHLIARGHIADELHDLYPGTKGKRGTVEFRPPIGGEISVLGLRFNPKGAFTTIPVMAK